MTIDVFSGAFGLNAIVKWEHGSGKGQRDVWGTVVVNRYCTMCDSPHSTLLTGAAGAPCVGWSGMQHGHSAR